MEIRPSRPSRLFPATGGGAGIASTNRCGHGDLVLSLHLFSRLPGQTVDDVGVLMPQCVARQLFGAALAYVQAADGPEAADRFLADMLDARDETLERLAEFEAEQKAQPPACCEAGATTEGREHTCRRTPGSPA
jgi:hypothetical protein